MIRSLASFALAAALLSSLGCRDAPSPFAEPGPIDQVWIEHRDPSGDRFGPMAVSRDTARIAALVRVAEARGNWTESWHTLPTGIHAATLYAGRRFVVALRFSPGFLLLETPTGAWMQKLGPAGYARLVDLTTWWPPRFEDYPAPDTMAAPAEFAGHYRFDGRGASRRIVDLQSGRRYDDPLATLPCGRPAYRRTSALAIRDGCAGSPVRYFVWNGDGLVELHQAGSHARTRAVAAP